METQTTTPNLDKIRDDKCVAVAKTILAELATSLMAVEGNFTDIVVKILSLMLANDLNVSFEVTEVPKMVLTALSGLNQTIQLCDLKNDDVRYNAIAQKILQIVVKANVRVNATPEETTADFAPFKDELKALFDSEKMSQIEVKYIMDNILGSYESMNNLFNRSIDGAVTKMEAKALGVEDMTDLTLKTLDIFLKSEVE